MCVLVGESSSGKSTVLAAVWTLLEAAAPMPTVADVSHGYTRIHVEADSRRPDAVPRREAAGNAQPEPRGRAAGALLPGEPARDVAPRADRPPREARRVGRRGAADRGRRAVARARDRSARRRAHPRARDPDRGARALPEPAVAAPPAHAAPPARRARPQPGAVLDALAGLPRRRPARPARARAPRPPHRARRCCSPTSCRATRRSVCSPSSTRSGRRSSSRAR